MPVRGYRGVAGQPTRPYVLYSTNQNSDIWLNLTFLDRTNALAVPTSVSYRIDNLTTDDVVLSDTDAGTTASNMSIHIPAALNAFNTDVGYTSQNNQVTVTAIYVDGSQTEEVFVYELIAIQTVGGN